MTLINFLNRLKQSDYRLFKANINIFYMFIIKGVTVLISFLYVPLLINSLDSFNYGIWITITSILSWFYLLDAGLGNGLRNKLSISLSKNDIVASRKYISTAYASISILVIFLVIVYFLISPFISWCDFLNIPNEMESEISLLMDLVFSIFFVQFIFGLINSIMLAFQWPVFSSLINMISQILSFIFIAIIVYLNPNPSLLILGFFLLIIPLCVTILSTIVLFKSKIKIYKPSIYLIRFHYLNDILSLGVKFFILQIITIVIYQTATILVARILGQETVADFNIAFRYMGITSVIFSIIITPFWSGATEAYQKGDLNWIRKINYRLLIYCGILSIFSFILVIFSKSFYHLWLGSSVVPNLTINFLFFIYFTFTMIYGSVGYLLNGIGKIKLQMYVTGFLALSFIPLAWFLGSIWGLIGILMAMIAVSVVNSIWSYIQFSKIVNNKAFGIWAQ